MEIPGILARTFATAELWLALCAPRRFDEMVVLIGSPRKEINGFAVGAGIATVVGIVSFNHGTHVDGESLSAGECLAGSIERIDQ